MPGTIQIIPVVAIRFILALVFSWWVGSQDTGAALKAEQYLKESDEWFSSAAGRQVANNVLSWQTHAGDWPKNADLASKAFAGDREKLRGTFDNGATTAEIRLLARAFRVTKDDRYRESVFKGVDHILAAQYLNGGWPQYSPPPANSYHRHITFNDGTMLRLLELLRSVATSADLDFVDSTRRESARRAFDRGIECILKCQIIVQGKLMVWCAQHDEKDFSPRSARTFELVSLSGAESAGVLRLLMTLDRPSPEIIRAVIAGTEWFETAKLSGLRQTRVNGNTTITPDPDAPPLWARFYEIDTGRPLFAGRDGVPKYSLADIEAERRNGYAWYGFWGEAVANDCTKWSKKWLGSPK